MDGCIIHIQITSKWEMNQLLMEVNAMISLTVINFATI